MSVSAGRVLPIPKGAWDSGTTYEMLDMVGYDGNMYIAKRQNVNVTPTEGADWMLSAEGATGVAVTSFNGRTGAVVPTSGDYDIEDMGDTDISTPTTGQVLKYNGTSGKWENGDISVSLDGLTDTNISSPSNGQALVYDTTSSKWINATPSNSLEGLSDTTITLPSNAQILKYDSANSKWINSSDNLSNQGDVTITTPADKQLLQYNGTSSKWENKALYKVLTATLTAGQTTVTFTDNFIVSNSMCELQVVGGTIIAPTAITDNSANHSVTYTFDAQDSNVSFKLLVLNI